MGLNQSSPLRSLPVRYRCGACGNLTRFDVTSTRTARAYHHYSVGGELTVDEVQVLDERIDEVTCRWCGHGRAIETVPELVTESVTETVQESVPESVTDREAAN